MVGLFYAGYGGANAGMKYFLGVILPYAALAVFLIGVVYRVLAWAKVPVPFRITTTCGGHKTHDWLPRSKLDNPSNAVETIGRMLLEVLTFRSLLKNTKTQLGDDNRPVYATEIFLWLGAIVFHYCFLVVLLRHLRLFVEPTPFFVTMIERADGFFQIGTPVFYLTSFGIIAGLAYLLARRLFTPQVRYISLLNDYFPLFLLLGIAISGFWLRYISKSDIVAIKELATGLATASPPGAAVLANISPLFFGHFFLVSMLLIYFPFSKLMHMAGVFLSPTRNMANNNRAVRHINPWNYPVKLHTYEEYEEEFGDLMKAVGLPVEKE